MLSQINVEELLVFDNIITTILYTCKHYSSADVIICFGQGTTNGSPGLRVAA